MFFTQTFKFLIISTARLVILRILWDLNYYIFAYILYFLCTYYTFYIPMYYTLNILFDHESHLTVMFKTFFTLKKWKKKSFLWVVPSDSNNFCIFIFWHLNHTICIRTILFFICSILLTLSPISWSCSNFFILKYSKTNPLESTVWQQPNLIKVSGWWQIPP